MGTEGEHAGVLYDFFVSPREDIRAVYALMELVLDLRANKLAICEEVLLTSFFEQFGFEAVAILGAGGAPSNWIPDACKSGSNRVACPDFVFMARKSYETSPAVTSWQSRVRDLPRANDPVDGRRGPCANCAGRISSENHFDLFGGYQCKRCGFIYVCGTLTLGLPHLN